MASLPDEKQSRRSLSKFVRSAPDAREEMGQRVARAVDAQRETHTPGPWKVIPPGHGHATGYQCVQFGADDTYTSLEMLPADARLCAAAPDLLEVLNLVYGCLPLSLQKRAKAVLDKAEGRS
jgi:hypothetical protein